MKSKRTKTIILSCVVVLIVACVCLVLIAISGVGVSLIWPFGVTQEVTVPTPYQATLELPQTTESPEATPKTELPADLVEAMTLIEEQVSQIRALNATGPVERTLISAAELEEIVAEDFFSDYSDQDARQDILILSALGLLPKDFDLKQFYNELYGEQIAGFYDDEEEAMYIVQGMGFGGSEKLTYAHEFTHVLQDQVYGLDEGLQLNDESCEADSERCAAVQALIEGDATMTELLWFQSYATQEDYEDLVQVYENFESPVFDSAPPYIAADLYFSYEKGQVFVQLLYNEGGFGAVDDAFENVPVSTEQILHPERYPHDAPVTVSLPDFSDALGEGWTLIDQNVMGEWYTFLILNKAYDEVHQLDETFASTATEGWGGDSYAFYLNEGTDEVVFILDTVWDTVADADEFAAAFLSYANLRWESIGSEIMDSPTWVGLDGMVVFVQNGDRSVWVMAPTQLNVESILSELQ